MPKYVVYEVWTKARVIDAKDMNEAYTLGEPIASLDRKLNLSNWHVVFVTDEEKGR